MQSNKTIIIETIGLLVISLVVINEGIRLTRYASSQIAQEAMNPGTYIIVLGALLMLTTLTRVTFYFLRNSRVKENHVEKPREGGTRLTVLAMVFVLALYIVLIQFLGYLIATPIFFLLMFWAVGMSSWRKNVIMTVILTAAYYLVFVHYCSIIFPRGIFAG